MLAELSPPPPVPSATPMQDPLCCGCVWVLTTQCYAGKVPAALQLPSSVSDQKGYLESLLSQLLLVTVVSVIISTMISFNCVLRICTIPCGCKPTAI